MDGPHQPAAQQEPLRPRVTNACEACRVAKVKCQASNQLGICRRCLDSKRECIFKTGPRTRRPRQSKLADTTTPRPPPPAGPSKTFTIDIPMQIEDEMGDGFEALRGHHEGVIDDLVPHDSPSPTPSFQGNFNLGHGDPAASSDIIMKMMMGSDPAPPPNDDVCAVSTAGSVASHTSSLPLGASALSTPPSSVVHGHGQGGKKQSRSIASLSVQPQFNVDSAAALLTTFRERMLPHFPCVAFYPPKVGDAEGKRSAEASAGDGGKEGITVASLARTRPFVLLAVLAAASGSRTLQGHSLYDEEFRKILGLKFVTSGERSLELLQGLVLYVAWYPFHLRPKNKQAFQYVRMAVDLVHDLELDQDSGPDNPDGTTSEQRLEEMRTYLATYYLVCNFATTWNKTPSLVFTEYTSRCCDILEHHSGVSNVTGTSSGFQPTGRGGVPGDSVLAWHVRLQRIVEAVNDLRQSQKHFSQTEYQIGLMLKGMESQLAEWETRIAPTLVRTPSLRLALSSTRVFLSGAPLLKLPSIKNPALDASSPFRADPARLWAVIPQIRDYFDFVLTLPADEINAFSGIDWAGFIHAIILGFRLSFPLPVCPEWDAARARREIRFGEYLDRFCRMGGGVSGGGAGGDEDLDDAAEGAGGEAAKDASPAAAASRRSMDVLSASKVVLAVVRKKYRKRIAKLDPPPPPRPAPAHAPATPSVLRSSAMAFADLTGLSGLSLSSFTGGGGGGAAAREHPGQMQVDPAVTAGDRTIAGCPMMDGPMDGSSVPFYQYWDDTYANHGGGALSGMGGGVGMGDGQMLQNHGVDANGNLWAMMTMGWAQNDINFENM